MRWVLDHIPAGILLSLPCDDDPNWVTSYHQRLSTVDSLTPAMPGDYGGYEDVPRYKVRRGHRLRPAELTLARREHIVRLSEARSRLPVAGNDLPPMQVSIPNALDLSIFVFSTPVSAIRRLGTFRSALLEDVNAIRRQFDQNTVFQLESPAVLAGFDKCPRTTWPAVARLLARQLATVILGSPVDTRWIVHLCCGDLAHQPLAIPPDLFGVVLVVNSLHRIMVRHARAMPAVHIPMCWGQEPPPGDAQFYQPLAAIHPEVEIIAGVAQETATGRSGIALELAEQALGRPAHAVAAACGLGRRTAAAAAANIALTENLARKVPPTRTRKSVNKC